MGNCLQKQKSEKQLLRDQLLKDKDDTGMITFYEKESEGREEKEEIPSVYDETFDVEINLDDRYKLWEWLVGHFSLKSYFWFVGPFASDIFHDLLCFLGAIEMLLQTLC